MVTILVAIFLLMVGVAILAKTLPVAGRISEKTAHAYSSAFLAEKIFAVMEQAYGSSSGPAAPGLVEGSDPQYPEYRYAVRFEEKKADLFTMRMELFRLREGREEREEFWGTMRRKPTEN